LNFRERGIKRKTEPPQPQGRGNPSGLVPERGKREDKKKPRQIFDDLVVWAIPEKEFNMCRKRSFQREGMGDALTDWRSCASCGVTQEQ